MSGVAPPKAGDRPPKVGGVFPKFGGGAHCSGFVYFVYTPLRDDLPIIKKACYLGGCQHNRLCSRVSVTLFCVQV